jgi:beta-phosphoglucomutase family hydrolase
VLFDLDGVLTPTASVHAAAWKEAFDQFLAERARRAGEAFRPFDAGADYRAYVDGKPRVEGVRSFLASRDIELPEGTPDDPPGNGTLHALGNLKNEQVRRVIEERGVESYPGSVALLRRLRERGVKTAVVSSSHNAAAVLRSAGIDGLFDARVDGAVAQARGLPGKPAPDTFLAAAAELGAPPERAVVVEDALAGVQAGRAGRFGLVVGVDRGAGRAALREHGADVVVADVGELVDA